MDNEEAKFILEAYRSNGADAGNAHFCEALRQAERDPELRRWFEKEQSRDKAVATKIKAIPVPAGLRESILAGSKLSTTRRVWWQKPGWLALAASVAILCAVGVASKTREARTDWSDLTARVIDDAAHPERHGSHGASVKELVATLSNPTTRLSAPMAIDLGRLKADGCRTLTVAGHDVAEICFERDGGVFHLYVMNRPEGRDLPQSPRFAANEGIHSVMWVGEHHLYVMTTTRDESALRALL